MQLNRAIAVSVMIVIVFAVLAGYVAGQRQVPTLTVGQSEELLRSLDLSYATSLRAGSASCVVFFVRVTRQSLRVTPNAGERAADELAQMQGNPL